ncbi:MAG: DUF4258 domain-containing protein [Thermomicrobiales bacterium]
MNFRLSHHARQEMERRAIPPALLQSVLQNPQQIVPEEGNKKAYQSQVDFGNGRMFLLRAIVADTVDPAVVVTVYRTSKFSKYWRSQ